MFSTKFCTFASITDPSLLPLLDLRGASALTDPFFGASVFLDPFFSAPGSAQQNDELKSFTDLDTKNDMLKNAISSPATYLKANQ